MSETERLEGTWWLPEDSDKVSSGTLVLGGGNRRLENVSGPVADPADGASFGVGPAIILGDGPKGKRYTLLKSVYSGKSRNFGTTRDIVATIQVGQVLEGAHYYEGHEIQFRQARFEYSNLHAWLYHELPMTLREVSREDFFYEIKHTRSTLWMLNLAPGLGCCNDYNTGFHSNTIPFETTFYHRDVLRVDSKEPRSIREFQDIERKFRALVNLLGECQLDVSAAEFKHNQDDRNPTRLVGERWSGGFAKRDDPDGPNCPVEFRSIPDFGAMLTKWFAEYDKLGTVVNLFLYGKQNTMLDIANEFLGLMQALEAFHRTFYPGAFMDAKAYQKEVAQVVSSAIPESVEGAFRDRLKAAIKYGYEYSLRKRLADLVESLPNLPIFDQVRNKGFRGATVETRNAMVHQLIAPENPPMTGEDLYSATVRWREVLFALILGRLGLPAAVIKTAAQRAHRRNGTFIPI